MLPTVILLSLLVVQWALIWHGRHVAEAAAQNGLRTARGYDATAADGQTAASRYLSAVAPNLLKSPQVDVTRTATTATVQVRARVLAVVPGLTVIMSGGTSIEEHASGPVERFVP